MISSLIPPLHGATIALANPFAGADQQTATWFHAHLTQTIATVLKVLSEPGSSEWVGVALFCATVFFLYKRCWPSLITLVVAVPGGMLLNELVKILVHRQRPFLEGPFVDWSGYSFASGHTIGATLLYGQLVLFIVPAMKSRHWRAFIISIAALLVLAVGFSRIALGAHYLTDVLAAMLFGIFWLAFCLVAGKPMRRRSSSRYEVPSNLFPDGEKALVPISQSEESIPKLLS